MESNFAPFNVRTGSPSRPMMGLLAHLSPLSLARTHKRRGPFPLHSLTVQSVIRYSSTTFSFIGPLLPLSFSLVNQRQGHHQQPSTLHHAHSKKKATKHAMSPTAWVKSPTLALTFLLLLSTTTLVAQGGKPQSPQAPPAQPSSPAASPVIAPPADDDVCATLWARQECGYLGITKDGCQQRQCCWSPTLVPVPWCFQKKVPFLHFFASMYILVCCSPCLAYLTRSCFFVSCQCRMKSTCVRRTLSPGVTADMSALIRRSGK